MLDHACECVSFIGYADQQGEPQACSVTTPVSGTCVISPLAVHPTQFALGFRDVTKKRTKIPIPHFKNLCGPTIIALASNRTSSSITTKPQSK
jgi:hypothetical protein